MVKIKNWKARDRPGDKHSTNDVAVSAPNTWSVGPVCIISWGSPCKAQRTTTYYENNNEKLF